MTKRFIIAEDNDFFRETIVQMLVSRNGTYACVGEAKDGATVVGMVERHAPDLLILDLRMPEMNGFEVMDALRDKPFRPPILVLTMSHAEGVMQKAFELGADGYCTKTSGRAALLEAVAQVAGGRRYVSPDMPPPD